MLGGGALLALGGLGACAAARPGLAAIEAAFPPRGRFVEVEGLRVHYVEMGPEEGQPVVLIHGASGNLNDMTFDLAPRLAGRFRVVSIDRPGLGYTQRPARDGWDPMVQARLLRGAADALGLSRPVVVGHSWGAAVAVGWALSAPEGVAGVVSVSGATMPWGDGDGALTPVITSQAAAAVGVGILRLSTLRDQGRGAARRIFRPQPLPDGYLEHLQPELILRTESFRANVEDIQRLDGALARMAARHGDLRLPVAVLHGAADKITGAALHAEAFASRLPDSRVELFEGVGHMLHHARPESVVAAVERLVA